MTLNELRVERGRLVKEMRDLNDLAGKENRSMTAEESEKWGKLDAAQEELKARIDREERQAKLDAEMNQPAITPGPECFTNTTGTDRNQADIMLEKRSTKEYNSAFNSFLIRGLGLTSPQELRALQMDVDSAGGYIVVPEQFYNTLIQAVDDEVYIRKRATVIKTPNAASLGVPVLDADASDAEWTSELLTGSDDDTMKFGKRKLFPGPLTKRIKISNDLLRTGVMNVDALVRSRFAYKFGVAQENAFLNGTGAGQPLGVMTASALGISTDRDVSTDNTSSAITADGLVNAKYTMKDQYMRKATWIFHRDALKMIRKLKTTTSGDYVWRAGLAADKPDTILDLPFQSSEYMPHTFNTTCYVGVLGDFSFYWIADAMDMSIQVVDQLYAATNQTGYFARLKCDGMPVLEEAFVRVKLG